MRVPAPQQRRSLRPSGSWRTGLWLLLLAGCISPAAAVAQKPAAANAAVNVAAPRAAAPQIGATLYAQQCAFCHGAEANGGAEAPSLLRSQLVRHDQAGDQIAPVLRNGRPDKGMPRLGLSEAQIADLVAFLHLRLRQADHPSPGHPGLEQTKAQLLTGDAKAGAAFFNGPGGCSHCHSLSGDLAHLAAKQLPADLQAHLLMPKDPGVTATVTLASGRSFSGKLLTNDGFVVALRDAAGWYRSWPASAVKLNMHDPLAAHRRLLPTLTDAEMHNLFAYLEAQAQ